MQRFQPLQRTVKRRLFDGVQPARFAFDFVEYIVAVFVAVVEAAQNNGVDMPSELIDIPSSPPVMASSSVSSV